MRKVFLYLYPIREYIERSIQENCYDNENGFENPIFVLNECIQERYRKRGFEIYFANYPDRELYGVQLSDNDNIIYTDITFNETSEYNEDSNENSIDQLKYPNEQYLLNQIGDVKEIVIGGFHSDDCVKRVAEFFSSRGIDTLIDMELTDRFFHLYKKSYFMKENYNPANYEQYIIALGLKYHEPLEILKKQIEMIYGHSIYKFDQYNPTIVADEILEMDSKNKSRR